VFGRRRHCTNSSLGTGVGRKTVTRPGHLPKESRGPSKNVPEVGVVNWYYGFSC